MPPMTETATANNGNWESGWYRFARKLESPNFGPRSSPVCIDLIVLHSISLPPGTYGGDEVQALFTNQLDWSAHPYFKQIEGLEVSAHFYIRRSGEIWQFVSCDDRAWHAGVSHYRGRDNCNDDSIGIELEGLEGESFEPAQYKAMAALYPALTQRYPIQYVAGHEHIAPGRKTDPGAGLDWTLLQKILSLADQCFPASVLTKHPDSTSSRHSV
jgi:AmpD protein